MKDKILSLLKELNIPYRVETHVAVFTVAEATQHIKDKRPIKNLLLQNDKKDRTFLVIMDGEEKLDMKTLAKKLGAKKLRFASPEVMMEKLGVEPGSVSLFGVLSPNSGDVEVIIDQSLLNEPELGFHPNDNTATIFIAGSAVEKILRHLERKYQIVSL